MTQPRAWRAVQLAPQAGLELLGTAGDDWSTWARGVIQLALGDFATAFGLLQLVAAKPGEAGGLASAKIASGLRQLDEHEAAVAWDTRARGGEGRAVPDGLIGLAADAVGRADPHAAAAYLAQARGVADGWRDEVRMAWVATEIALLQGRDAVPPAEQAYAWSAAQGSPRHRVKSGLFLAAALQASNPSRATVTARGALVEAGELALAPFVWPLVAVLADEATPAELVAGADAVRFIAARLPPGHGAAWLARMRPT